MLESHFATIVSVWTPPDGTPPAALAEKLGSAELAERLGFPLQAWLLGARERVENATKRRLKLTCPQRPGIVLAITEVYSKLQACDGLRLLLAFVPRH